MFEIRGKYNTAIVYAGRTDQESVAQVMTMCNTPYLADSRIRMMPDMHAAEGCTVGTSMTLTGRANPAWVGGDIGCGMQVYRLREREIDCAALDAVIRSEIPSGAAIFPGENKAVRALALSELICYDWTRKKTVDASLGTLGGGNHFIEVDRDTDGALYLVIHSGSRRLGRDVATYWQNEAFCQTNGFDPKLFAKRKIDVSKASVKKPLCWLEKEALEGYLHDMTIAVRYAVRSRELMGETILQALNLHVDEAFTTIHNYIDVKHGVLRKGAVSAQAGEKLIIPINMRDGSLICMGKGNPEWNCTAPHGAGRMLTRSQAKEEITLAEYQAAMAGIYTTSVSESTLDESPMAYRAIDEILDVIEDTAEVTALLTPIYNFKASKAAADEETMDGND
ncbi:MAG: RtcB family protein [Clostridiales bacterium]|nr:RtcB family protein [Clostridiales bacterium]